MFQCSPLPFISTYAAGVLNRIHIYGSELSLCPHRRWSFPCLCQLHLKRGIDRVPDTILTRLMKSALSAVTFPWEMHNRISWQYPDKTGLSWRFFRLFCTECTEREGEWVGVLTAGGADDNEVIFTHTHRLIWHVSRVNHHFSKRWPKRPLTYA